MPLTAGTRLGAYQILDALGAGGMGEVYRARDTKLDRDVALKILPASFATDPDRVMRFTREAKTLAALNHPNVAAIYGIEAQALVMELVEGEDLSALIARGPIALADALPIARQIADAIEAAHEQGIIHRDLKPANVKVRADGTVKVLDFGLAKAIGGAAEAAPYEASNSPTLTARATQMGMILGTAAYMSPEQAKGRPVDRRADIWAFGAVLYEMLTGRRAFAGDDVTETLASVIKDTPSFEAVPAGTPRSLIQLMARCLERDVRMRLRDIGEARIALATLERGSMDAPAESPAPRARHRYRWIAAGVVAGAAVTALGLYAWDSSPAGTPAGRVRFQLVIPEAARLTARRPTLSPDGRFIVFVASAGSDQQLWLRPLDGDDAKALAGTEGGDGPFWSPDSSAVAFFASGKLKRLDLATGAVQVVCDSAEFGGGSWSRDGVIVFAPMLESPLFRVPAAGGTPTQLTTFDAANSESNHMWPHFLPDGRHYLYQVFGLKNAGLYLGSLDSEDRTRLIPQETLDLTSVQYASSGHLLYIRNHQLVAHPFDAASRTLTGDAVPLAGGFGIGGAGDTNFSVSQTGAFAFQPEGARRTIQLTWFGRSGEREGTLGAPGPYSSFSLSPDGRTVAYDRFTPEETAIWLLDVARGTSTRFTSDTYSVAPSWSPNGDALVFGSVRNTPPNPFMRTLAGIETRLATVPGAVTITGWAPDGRSLIGEMASPSTNDDLWQFQLTPGALPTPFLQTNFREISPRISPDGKWVSFGSNESGSFEVYVTSFPVPGRHIRVSTAGGLGAHWRDDGAELFFQSQGRVMAASIAGGAGLEIGAPRVLFELPERRGPWVPAPGGRRFLVGVQTAPATALPMTVVVNWAARPEAR